MAEITPTQQSTLSMISQYESGNQNIPNYRYDPTHTAQGYYQITNTNWLNIAPKLGIDTSIYPNAMSAPQDVQAQVANYLLTQTPAGISNWTAYNPQLAAAVGLQSSDTLQASGALVDLSGPAASQSTSDILSSIEGAIPNIDLTNPVTDIAIAAAAGLLLWAVLR